MIKHIGFFCWSLASVVLSSGLIVKYIDNLGSQRELYAVMVALENECKYNTQARVSEESSFQTEWLTKALSLLDFHEQCPELVKKSLEISELMKDANSGKLSNRTKNTDNEAITHAHLLELIQAAIKDIEDILPTLKYRATFKGYTCWLLHFHTQ